ncbi:MAG: hypothetical protein ACR2GX_00340 [Candidatus Dormibacteria bacterium]
MPWKRMVGPAALAAVVASCGQGPTSSALPSSRSTQVTGTPSATVPSSGTSAVTPTASPVGPGLEAHLSATDTGTTLETHVGATTTVQLAAVPGSRWSEPASSGPAIVVVASPSQATDGGAQATLRSLAAGRVEITATSDPNCRPSCGRLSRLWQVTVVVTAP